MSLTTRTGFAYDSKFTITQHRYVGGDDEGTHGYIELLEIHDAPLGMASVVIVFWGTGHPYTFWEFVDLDSALAAWGEHWPQTKTLDSQPGWRTKARGPDLECKPWFYAAEGDELRGYFLPQDAGMRYLVNGASDDPGK